jgi:Flp pilus assembly protein TadB
VPDRLTTLDAISILFGLSAALVVFGLFAERQRRMMARRVATFIGVPVDIPAREGTAIPRLRFQPGSVGPAPSVLRSLLLAIVAIGLAVGLIAGEGTAFVVAATAALILLILVSRAESQERIERQIPAAVRLIASGLRAGLSVPQTLALVARESPEPTASEFGRAAQEVLLGSSLDEALSRLAARTARDYALVATIVSVQHEVGGNLAQALDAVAETLRERAELRQQAAAISAQQQLSALVLTALPIVVFLYTFFVTRQYLDPLFESVIGRLMLVLAGALLVVGWRAMRWVGRFEET